MKAPVIQPAPRLLRQATRKEIRVYLRHGEGNRRVKIGRDGLVIFYGSVTTDGPNYWQPGGHTTDYWINTDLTMTVFEGPGIDPEDEQEPDEEERGIDLLECKITQELKDHNTL